MPFSTPIHPLKAPIPFKIDILEKELEEFKTLLRLNKVPNPTFESLQEDGRFGVSHKWISEAKRFWLDEFDWRKKESHINSFPNFKSQVKFGDGEFGIHFVGLFSEREDAVPVVLLHGWPGSFLEFLPILGILREKYTPKTLPYHLIVPSLPGYAFSDTPPLDREFGLRDIGNIINQLLLDLGFGAGYLAQGGDIGAAVSRMLAVDHEACKGALLNFLVLPLDPPVTPLDTLTEYEKEGVKKSGEFMTRGAAYSMEHATRPATIGLVLGSSPLALLAWIGEKFLEWSDVSPDLDTILESVTLYWFTESMGRGIYPYRGRFKEGRIGDPTIEEFKIRKPFGFSSFHKELIRLPESWIKTTGDLVFWREYHKGGHFAALEQPELLLGDFEEFVEQVWKK